MPAPSNSTPTGTVVTHPRPTAIPLDLAWLRETRVNRPAAEQRAATLTARRSIKRQWQAAWLLRALSCIDLTTLEGSDTPARVLRLCAKARQPLRAELIAALGLSQTPQVAAVCVYHSRIHNARRALRGSDIPIAAVSAGFPSGQTSFRSRLLEIEESVEAGASEIDIVISRAHVLSGDWPALYDEVAAFRERCGDAHLKAILATGELGTLTNIARASLVCMMAGADFIKTSTGKEAVNATLPVGLVMARAIRSYHERTGQVIGFKPAGGIRSTKQALAWQVLMREELGAPWLAASRFRIGASGLLADIERQLHHHATGRYAAAHHIPLS
ncbi:MAG: deoxyribose-phosphate aldolase [Anaerolineaceae bacterium]|nr:deoxyribose-phosphate aldolase [Anaerolineaceae bacterium]